MTPDWSGLRMALEGTVTYDIPEDMATRYGVEDIDPDTIADEMLDQGIEQCPTCETWVESGELVWDETGEEVYGCEACQ